MDYGSSAVLNQWYLDHRHELSGHGLWLRGGEMNTLPLSDLSERGYRALFVRLSTYMDVGYSFTHPLLYQWAASVQGVFPDLAYLPPPKDAQVFRRDGIPWLLGTQTKLPGRSFDLIGFSNSIVQELINVKHFLETSDIPLTKSERNRRSDAGEALPLLILGGANALFSWSTLLGDPWVDGVYVGESDAGFKKLLEMARDAKAQGKSRAETLSLLETIPGFFQPEKAFKTKKNFVMNLNESESLERAPVLFQVDQAGSGHLQISEGCPCFCSFCAEAWERRPYRERSAATLRKSALAMKAALGLDSIDIYSFNFNMHSELYQVLWDLVPEFRNIGLKSQRFDLLAHDPEMLKFQQTLNKTSITCGLEGISPRLREYLNKNVSVDELHKSIEAIFKNKARELKVFLIATGLEEDQDFVALGDFLEHLRDLLKQSAASTRVIFSMTPLVRFPWTPLEFEQAQSTSHLDAIVKKATRVVRGHGFEFRESADMPEYWVSQVLARADRPEITTALASAIDKTGFVYYREVPEHFRAELAKQLGQVGLDQETLFAGYDLVASKKKPWAQVDVGVFREFLWSMFQSLQKFKALDYCLGRSWAKAKCSHCGGCPTRFHVRDIVLAKQTKPHTFESFKTRYVTALNDEVRVGLRVDVGRAESLWELDWIGVPRKFVAVDLARALMRVVPELVHDYRGYRGSTWDQVEKPVWIEGEDRIELAFSKRGAQRVLSMSAEELKALQVEMDTRKMTFLGVGTERTMRKLEVSAGTPIELSKLFGKYLEGENLKHSLKRINDAEMDHDWSPQARKKDILRRAIVVRDRAVPSTRLELDLGSKFQWDRFAQLALGDAFSKAPWRFRVRTYGSDNSIAAAKPSCAN